MTELTDRAFPGLRTALSPESLLELLKAHLPESDSLDLRALDVLDVRYEPGRRCDLLYRIKGVDRESGRSLRQMISGRLVVSDEQPDVPDAALLDRYAGFEQRGLRTPWLYLEQPKLLLQAYPIDPALPHLFDALTGSAVAHGLNRMWDARKARVRRVRIDPLGYTPGARAAFDYQVLAESKRTGEPEFRQLIGKMHAKKPASRLFAGGWALWRAARERVDLAPPVGYVSSLNLTFQERVPGERLGGLAGAPAFTQYARRTARTIALLHGLEFPLWTRRKPNEEASVVLRWSAVLRAIRPDLAERIEHLRDQLIRELEARTTLKGPVHGDFHHTNVLVSGDRITIIDLDEMAFGDPLLDVGRFMASTRIPSLRAFGRVDGLEDAREAFLAEYLRKRPDAESRVRLFEAATLFTAAASAFRIQRPHWHEEVEIVLEEAEKTFRRAEAGQVHAVASLSAFEPTADPGPWLADPVYMRATLAPEIQSTYGAEITGCTVRDVASDGERATFRVRGWRGSERWSVDLAGIRTQRGAGLLRRLEVLHRALARVPDAPAIPRPVGYVRALSLLVCEVPTGTPLAALVGTAHAADSVARLARALAAMHSTSIELDRARSIDVELKALQRRTHELETAHPELGERVAPLAAQVARRVASAPRWTAPVVRMLHTQHVLLDDHHVTLGKVEDVLLGHPFFDTADFLARLALMGVKRGCPEVTTRLSDQFRAEYEAGSGRSFDAGTGFEAGALLRLACTQALREPGSVAAGMLVERAETLLEAA